MDLMQNQGTFAKFVPKPLSHMDVSQWHLYYYSMNATTLIHTLRVSKIVIEV
jgi:hypothetical protein